MNQVLTAEKKAQRVSRKCVKAISASQSPLVLESVQPEWVKALTTFYSGWSAQLTIAGEAIVVAPVWPDDSVEHPTSAIFVKIGDTQGELRTPRALVESWLFRADPEVDLTRLPAGHAALLLEAFFCDELARFEKQLGCQITVEAIEYCDVAASRTPPFVLSLTGKGGANSCTFHLDNPDLMVQVGRLLAASGRTTPRLPLDFPLEVSLLRDAVTITAAELESLTPGDVVLFDDFREAATAVIVIGNWFAAPVELTKDGARLAASLDRITGSKWEWIMKGATSPGTGQALEDSDLENLPITLVFELGRTVLPLGEVKEFTPGAIVPLGGSAKATVDVIANGKRVGRGEIVRIGECLGVRLVRMCENA